MQNSLNILKKTIPYILVIILDFYLFPLIITNTGIAILTMLIIIPIVAFTCSVVYGVKQGFHWQFSLVVALLFVPTIFIFDNQTAWVYVLSYGIISVLGNAVGMFISNTRKQKR